MVLQHPVVVQLVAAFPAKAVALWYLGTSYNRVARSLSIAAMVLGFPKQYFTSHSLRRGGATAPLLRGVTFADIMVYGQWTRIAKETLQSRIW